MCSLQREETETPADETEHKEEVTGIHSTQPSPEPFPPVELEPCVHPPHVPAQVVQQQTGVPAKADDICTSNTCEAGGSISPVGASSAIRYTRRELADVRVAAAALARDFDGTIFGDDLQKPADSIPCMPPPAESPPK